MLTVNCPIRTRSGIENVQPAIQSRLMAIKPGRVVQPYSEDFATHLLNYGSVMREPRKLSTRGVPNRCHYNASLRWLRNPKATIFFGYQNPSGDCWTQHAWNMCEGTILDRHDANLYFGVKPVNPGRFALECIFAEFEYSFEPSTLNRVLGKTAFARLLDVAHEQLRVPTQIEGVKEIALEQCSSHATRHMPPTVSP
jgi:hypothetical protein